MSKLTNIERDQLPKGDFAGPDRSYPIPDKSHASNAKARAQQEFERGRLTKVARDKIDTRANKMLK
jgi:hypothetical protein